MPSTPRSPTRVTAISLRRRPDRWRACEEHLRGLLGDGFDMFEGTDAKAAAGGDSTAVDRVAALEAATGCTVYRGWPITEVRDVRRCYASLSPQLSDAEAWMAYERKVAAAWRSDRSRLYLDFFLRHLTLGDVGAALSHLRVAERGHAEGLSLQVVFEDDVRPSAEALPALLREVQLLREAGVAWDLIYLHSAKYSRAAELPAHPASSLLVAGHRKVCDAYALSASGLRKIATCGFRASVFPVDDFLPALHSPHPREDVMALPCVVAARGGTGGTGGDGGDGGDGDGGRESRGVCEGGEGPFVALTFPDGAGLVEVEAAAAAASDSKAGGAVSVLLGDAGVEVEGGGKQLGGGVRPSPATLADPSPATGRESRRGALRPHFAGPSLAAALAGGAGGKLAAAARSLATRSYALLRASEAEAALLRRAEGRMRAFCAGCEGERRRCVGKGGRRGELLLWSCGYSAWPERRQFHVVCGAPDAQPWPGAGEAGGEAGGEMRSSVLEATSLLRAVALGCVAALAEGGAVPARLPGACGAVPADEDPSVFDLFEYEARGPAAAAAEEGGAEGSEVAMAEHTDPGVLTLTLASEVGGIQVLDASLGKWVRVEALCGANDVLVLACDQLQAASEAAAAVAAAAPSPATGGVLARGEPPRDAAREPALQASRHRIVCEEGGARVSAVYELRLPERVLCSSLKAV